MALLSKELHRLHDIFNDWISGTGAPFAVQDAIAFRRDLKNAQAKAALLELGVEATVFDDPAPNAVVIPFPPDRIVRYEVLL